MAELMRRGGHANPRAALRYQHAMEELAEVADVVPLVTPSETHSRT